MENLNEIQKNAKSLRNTDAQLYLEISRVKANLEKIESQILSLKKSGIRDSDNRLSDLLEKREKLVVRKNSFSDDLKSNKDLFSKLYEQLKKDYNPIKDIEQLDDSYPILLFPLRLETRFKKTGNQNQLWLRVYPDDCNVVKHEPHLTEDELADAKIFWAEIAKAGKIATEERGAWQVFAKSHGSNKASWVIEQYKPLNEIMAKADASYKVLVLFDENDDPKELIQEAVSYWKEVWIAQGNESKIENAKSQFKEQVNDDAYDYWTKLLPFNIADVLGEDVDDDKIIVAKIDLPNPDNIVTTKNSWNVAPQAVALPDKFVAIKYSNGNKTNHVFEHSVKNILHVGLDPSSDSSEIKKDIEGIHLHEELKWMVDFEEALRAGMATKIDLSSNEAQNGIEQLFVFGLRASSDAEAAVKELEDLILAHKNSQQGFGFIKQGTPTNNTEDNLSGYSWSEDVDESFDRLFKGTENFVVSDDVKNQSDAQRLAASLNVNADILQGLPNANGRDQLESIAMNTALFPATMGYFMEEMMDPLFSERDIEATRELFVNNISGRGPIPAIKIGKQPYGILPVTKFSNLQFNKDKHFENKLISLLNKFDETWDATVSKVSFIGKEGDVDAHQILLDVLGLHSNSVEFHQRYAQSIHQVYNQLRLSIKNPIVAGLVAAAIANRGKAILNELGLNQDFKLPILEKYFLSEPNILMGPLVDDVPESEIDPIRGYTGDNKNYLEWLQASDGNRIRLQNFDGNPIPNSLLYLLLRHSVLLSQANAGTNFLVKEKLIESKRVFHDPSFLHIQEKELGKSKFEHLYQSNIKVTKDDSLRLIDYIYKENVLGELAEANALKEVLQAINTLEKTPTARLERLLIEHLDCCTYRIDAWKTGLTYEQIKHQKQQIQRQQKERGIYLGAYGWLLDLRPKALEEKSLGQQEDAGFFAPKGEKIYTDSSNLGFIHAPSIDQAATAAILRNAYDSNKDAGVKNPFAINLTSERVRMANDFLEGIRNGQSLSALLGYQFERGLHDRYQSSNIEADKFIYPLRMAFPLVTDHLKSTQTSDADVQQANETNSTTDTSIAAIEARNVIDGLKLIQHIQNSSTKTYPFGKSGLPNASNQERDAITEEVNRLIDINDAIADLLMAEQVYQTVKGNFERAAGVANAYSNGGYPPEMEVVNTPRTGLALNHKVAIHFDADARADTSPNSVEEMTPKAQAEAAANHWLSDILPSPEKVSVKVKVKEPAGDESFVFVSQKDLGLQSIDLLFSAVLDNEQAMTELDDRIINFLLYDYKDSSGNSLNPFSELTILYTEKIDPDEKSEVSFFELGSTLNSLRKVLVNRPYVNHSSLQLPTESTTITDLEYDVDGFKNRIDTLKGGLQAKHLALNTSIGNVYSVQSILKLNEEKLKTGGVAENIIESLHQFLSKSLKNYALNKTSDSKTEQVKEFETLLDSNLIVDQLKTELISDFNTYLDDYTTDLSNIPKLINDTCAIFLEVALYDNSLTGTGFMHQAVGGIFRQVVEKVAVVVERWESKKLEYDIVMADYDSATTDEEKILLLQKAERKISSQGTYPVPADVNAYKTSVALKYTTFNSVLADLEGIATSAYSDVLAFLSSANTVLAKIANHDVVSYDTKNNRNDMYEEFKTLIQLQEDIYAAHVNLATHIKNKLERYDNVIATIDTLGTDNERIELLLNAAKQVLKEDILLIPHLKLSPTFGSTVQLAYDQENAIQAFVATKEDRLYPVEDWLCGVARVRENLWHVENFRSLANGYDFNTDIDLKPLQFPIRENARWLAMKFVDESEDVQKYVNSLEGDSLLYTAHFASPFDSTKSLCGIIIDEWTEVIPFKNETTGIAFHYDQPNSEPPQTMLLVTPSILNGKWEWDDVMGAMEETLAMAKKRAVEPSMIDSTKFGQFLPTTLMAVSSHWITVALNLSLNNFTLTQE